ncbi:MAG: ABC transporter permease, partial [Thermoanaerobaculia bacterium]
LVGGGSHYAANLVVGLVFWQLFIESAQTPLRIFAEARPMLGKLRFPREALVAAAILEVGLQFLVRVPLLVAAWLMTPGASAERWWLAPVSVAGLVVTGCLVGIILLPLSLLYEDVAPALALASGFWLLITPVAWSAPTAGFAATLAEWNPAAVLVTVARTWWLGFGEAAVPAFAAVAVSASAILLISWMMARVAFPHLIARFGS